MLDVVNLQRAMVDMDKYIYDNFNNNAKIGIIMGSGQANIKDRINIKNVINFKNIPGLRDTTVSGHSGQFVIGKYNEIDIICSLGRFHYYEGISLEDVTLPIKIFNMLGVKKIIVCNSSGCLKENWSVGDIMYINGCIDYSFQSKQSQGILFNSKLKNDYRKTLINNISKELDFSIKKGPYVWVTGPSYETPAEISDMVSLNGAAVGMSTFPEIKKAINFGMDVYGFAILTNYAAGISGELLSHVDVVNSAQNNIGKLEKTIFKLIDYLGENQNE